MAVLYSGFYNWYLCSIFKRYCRNLHCEIMKVTPIKGGPFLPFRMQRFKKHSGFASVAVSDRCPCHRGYWLHHQNCLKVEQSLFVLILYGHAENPVCVASHEIITYDKETENPVSQSLLSLSPFFLELPLIACLKTGFLVFPHLLEHCHFSLWPCSCS